jgi:3-oxoacyl-[acyl-carrier-protein] synthase II
LPIWKSTLNNSAVFMVLKRVVVTGMGAVTPLGNDVNSFWQSLINGKSGAAPITLFDASKFKTRFACEVKDFNIETSLEKKEARKMDRFCHFAIAASDEAINNSGINADTSDKNRIGVIWGSGIGGLKTFDEEMEGYFSGGKEPRFNPFFIPKMILDIAAGQVSIRNGFRGPNYATVSACASSSHAIIDAFNLIRLGKADAIIAGGSEAAITESGIGGFSSLHAMSKRNDDPVTASRPFDKDRDGFVLGEGGACLVLEELEHATKRGAKIYAELAGGGMCADAYHITAPHPDGWGASSVMKLAIEDASMKPYDIDYINVHGTSTPLGDISETKAIVDVFDQHAYRLNISSTKSMTGHLLGAAGAVEAVVSVLSVHHDLVPPTINHFTDDPEIDSQLNLTFNSAQKRSVNAALSNTFGFGGHNASIIFKKYL